MAVSNLVAASGGKTMFRTTLTSGTSYTVPAGVTYLNVTLVGAGGGGGFSQGSGYMGTNGMPGHTISSTLSATPGASIAYAIGAGGNGSASSGASAGNGGSTTFTGATTAPGGNGGKGNDGAGVVGSQSYATNGGGQAAMTSGQAGGAGGAGFIIVEYWA